MTDRLDAMSVRESNGKKFWTKLGVAFANRNGGWSLKLDAIPAPSDGTYNIVLMPPREQSQQSGGTRQPTGAVADDIPFAPW